MLCTNNKNGLISNQRKLEIRLRDYSISSGVQVVKVKKKQNKEYFKKNVLMIFIYPKLLCILEFYDRRGSPPPMGKLVKTTALKSNKEKEAAEEDEWKGGRNNSNMIK